MAGYQAGWGERDPEPFLTSVSFAGATSSRPCRTMPVEEFVAGWISGETFFSLLSHAPPPQWWSLLGDLGGVETRVLVALEHLGPPSTCGRGALRKPRRLHLQSLQSRHPAPLDLPCGAQKGSSPLTLTAILRSPSGLCPTRQQAAGPGAEACAVDPAQLLGDISLRRKRGTF